MLQRHTIKRFTPTLLLLGAGFLFAWLIKPGSQILAQDATLRETGKYQYINPVLLCRNTGNVEFQQYKPLETAVTDLINQKKESGLASDVAVYFRDLNVDHWMGINENETFAPASLLKVPTMIAYFRLAEDHPELLTKQFFYDGSFDDNKAESIKPLEAIEAGHFYSGEELVRRMIVYSDNNATRLLHESIDARTLREVYTDLGINFPGLNNNVVDFLSPKQYGFFFRLLYNSTYLNREFSEKAMELLSSPDFPQGILNGLPKGTELADKFGERTVYDDQTGAVSFRELHDCGIVYYPNHPYLLCIMTKGQNFTDLAGTISDLSSLIYNKVNQDYHTSP